MVAFANPPKQQKDYGILDEIQESHCYSLYVEHRGRWILGTRSASRVEAREAAIQTFNRSRLPVEIRLPDGTVVFGLRAGYPDVVSDLSE